MSDSFEVSVGIGEVHSVSVTGPSNIIPFVDIKVEDDFCIYLNRDNIGKLVISMKDISFSGLLVFGPIKVHVVLPKLARLGVSGSSDVNIEDIISSKKLIIESKGSSDIKAEVDVLELIINTFGSSDIDIKGKVLKRAMITTNDRSTVKAGDLLVSEALIEMAGDSELKIMVSDKMIVDLLGNSELKASKQPTNEVEIEMKANSEAKINVVDDLKATLLGNSELVVSGKPIRRNVVTKGNAEVKYR